MFSEKLKKVSNPENVVQSKYMEQASKSLNQGQSQKSMH